MRAAVFLKFLKWLYYPDMEPRKRPTPDVMKDILFYKRKEPTPVKAEHPWTTEEDAVFLKYCPQVLPLQSLQSPSILNSN